MMATTKQDLQKVFAYNQQFGNATSCGLGLVLAFRHSVGFRARKTMLEKQSQAADKERHLVILCVDDEKPALFLRSAVLTSAGYKVLTASSSGEALQVFRENDVDLVITDHLLVGATGTALAKQIKELRPQVPIVILSGVIDEPEGMAAANLFLSKNAGPTEMLAQVARLLNL